MFPTWAYTLDAAHSMNTAPLARFLGISTTIVQLPTQDNGMVAVVHATVRWRNTEGDLVEFGEVGDATPTNCGPVGKTALLRMAATRAKGRALRDSVNIGDVLEEEMGGDEDADAEPPAPPTPRRDAGGDSVILRAAVTRLAAQDAEGRAKLPKTIASMTYEELEKTRAWLTLRADRAKAPTPAAPRHVVINDDGDVVDPKGAHIVEKAVAEARTLIAAIDASGAGKGTGRPHAGDYNRMRNLLLVLQNADPWQGDADTETLPPAELLPYMRARVSGYVTPPVGAGGVG
jgi:hypothetical protein